MILKDVAMYVSFGSGDPRTLDDSYLLGLTKLVLALLLANMFKCCNYVGMFNDNNDTSRLVMNKIFVLRCLCYFIFFMKII